MPTWMVGRVPMPPRCRRAYTWSTSRGGCRFAPGHAGPCKPKAGRA